MTHQLTKLDKGSVSDNGSLIHFDIHTREGEKLDIEIPTALTGRVIAFLSGLGQFAGSKKAEMEQTDNFEGALIEASSVAYAEGRSDDEIILSIQLGEFALGIAIPKRGASPLQEALSGNKKPS